MPLMKSGSKRAMSKNISTEMHAGKPQKQAIAIAYSVMRRNKRKKMAEGGLIENEELNPRHEPGLGPQTGIEKDSIQSPLNDNLKELYDEDKELSRIHSVSSPEEDQPHGMLGMDAKSIVANLRAKRDNYPRPGDKYRDSYADDKYAEGGQVNIGNVPATNPDVSNAFKKAFGSPTASPSPSKYAEGGEVDEHLDSLSAHTDHLRREEGLDDDQVNSQFMEDDSLSQDNSPMPEDLSRGSSMIQAEDEDDQKKGRLDRIMSMLHSKHYGKR